LYFDDLSQAYKIREGYRGHLLKIPTTESEPQSVSRESPRDDDPRSIAMLAREAAQRLLVEAQGVVQALDRLSQAIEGISGPRTK
jgi:hypothetical protein